MPPPDTSRRPHTVFCCSVLFKRNGVPPSSLRRLLDLAGLLVPDRLASAQAAEATEATRSALASFLTAGGWIPAVLRGIVQNDADLVRLAVHHREAWTKDEDGDVPLTLPVRRGPDWDDRRFCGWSDGNTWHIHRDDLPSARIGTFLPDVARAQQGCSEAIVSILHEACSGRLDQTFKDVMQRFDVRRWLNLPAGDPGSGAERDIPAERVVALFGKEHAEELLGDSEDMQRLRNPRTGGFMFEALWRDAFREE